MQQCPIAIPQREWDRIKKWTDSNKEDPDAVRRREYVKALNEASSKMTKTWPNSLENVHKRNEEVRRARQQAAENANARFYKRYIKRKIAEQEQLMYSARDMIFKSTDAPKLLLSGVVESVVLKEREEQLKFNREVMGKYQREQQKLYDEQVFENSRRWHQLNDERKKRRFKVNKEHQRELLEQAHEVAERRRKEHEEELRMQQQDIINSNKEMEMLEEFENKLKAAEKARIWHDNTRSVEQLEARRHQARVRDHMDDKLIDVLQRSQNIVERRRRETEQAERKAKLAILEAISKNLECGTAERDAKEQASLDKAIAEREAAAAARHAEDVEKVRQHARDKRQARERFLQQERERLHHEHTLQQFALMNRFRNEEIYEDFKEQKRQELEDNKKKYKEELLRLRKEREDREAREREQTRKFYGELMSKKFRLADNKLFTHAAALLDEAEANGRPTLPIMKALDRYCKMYRLYPMPDLPATLQSHFPSYEARDRSAADPMYRPEPPPPAPPGYFAGLDDDNDDDDDDHRRDGLQQIIKLPPKPGAKKDAPPPKKGAPKEGKPSSAPPPLDYCDYKRQGRANGLQARPEPEDVSLPPIKILPCKMHECICDLKGATE